MEPLFYEAKPWFYTIVSLWSIVYSSHSAMLLFSGMLLALAATIIIHSRFSYRSKQS